MQFDYQLFTSVCLGIALSACCGFRVFIPLLAASIAGYNHFFTLPADMQWLAGWPAITCFIIASILEIGAYYIPFLDNILDTIATPLAVIAGTILASSIIPLPEDMPLIRWGAGLIAGGATAGTIQASTSLLRLFSTKATVGTGNVLIASVENAAALSGAFLSFIIPIVTALILVIVVIWVLFNNVRRLIRREGKI